MKLSLYITIVLLFCVSITTKLSAQGCVAVRNMASSCSVFDSTSSNKGLQFSANYRFFRSYKHFVGTQEQHERVEQGTEVINNDNSLLLGLSYTMNKRWSFGITVPLLYIDRSSLYEHKGNTSGERYHTQSQGLGDIRASAYYTVIPQRQKDHLTTGLGVKAPTGNYHYKDYFHKADGLQLLYVDQSMQLGDGGWGISAEFDASIRIFRRGYIYGSGLYLSNPRNTNGVQRSANLTTTATNEPIPLSNEFSVADQYMLRAGVRYLIHSFQVGLGGRVEEVTANDLIGREDGFRRPGRIGSIEPSLSYARGSHAVGVNVPFAVYRKRTRSYTDVVRGTNPTTGQRYNGDAAFADRLWSISYVYKFKIS